MGLSRRHLGRHTTRVSFDPAALGAAIGSACPEVMLAFLHGSARDGQVEPGSDIDIAVYLDRPASLDLHARIVESVERLAPGPHCDVGVLNDAEPVYRFEALKGRLVLARDRHEYARFFSLACRQYEAQMADYRRQLRYRTGAA